MWEQKEGYPNGGMSGGVSGGVVFTITLLGFGVRVSPLMPKGVVAVEGRGGKIIRIFNLGQQKNSGHRDEKP